MYDKPASPRDLSSIFHARQAQHVAKHGHQYEMELVGRGVLPGKFEQLFTEHDLIYLLNFIRLGGENMAGKIGQMFPLYFAPDDETDAKRNQAERREMICYGYYSAGQKVNIGFNATIKAAAWHLAFQSEAILQVKYDYERGTPYITHRHPIHHFAPKGWHSWGDAPLNGTMFAYKDTLENLCKRYPHVYMELHNQYRNQLANVAGDREKVMCTVGEYYHTDAWYLSTMDDNPTTLFASESGDRRVWGPDYVQHLHKGHPGVCPIAVISPYDPQWPRSIYADQIGHMAVLARMLTQSIDWTDKNLEPKIFISGLEGDELEVGPGGVTRLTTEGGEKPFVEVVRPEGTAPSGAMMQFLIAVDRMLNRHPEIEEGAGEADSAKALNELKSGPIESVREYFWPPMFQAIPKVLGHCMRMDININGNDQRVISGRTPELHDRKQNVPFTQKFRPYRDLHGYEDSAEVEPGILLKYMGHIDNMQAVGAEMMSRHTALEFDDRIRDVRREEGRLDLERIDRLTQKLVEAQAERISLGGLAEAKRLVVEEGISLAEAFQRLDQSGQLYLPPAPAPGMEGAPGAGGQGMPSPQDILGMAAGLEAGGGPETAPSLRMIQGGAGGP